MSPACRLTRLALAAVAPLFSAVAWAMPVVLLQSDVTEAYFRAHGGDYERILAPWRAFFARQGVPAQELRAEELPRGARPGVVVLASAVALGEAERAAIRARLREGWSVLGTWALGVRDGSGQWSGYGFIEELFSAEVAADLAPGKGESFLLPYGETPLTHALPAGKRIYLLPTSEPFLRVRSANGAARFGNYMREATLPGALLAAAAFEERHGARRAYLGFAETSWASAQADVDALLLGALKWLQRAPIVVKAAWPHPHQAALLLEMDTEDKFDNSVRFAELLERHGIRGTFYSVTSEAEKFPAVLKRLAARHEIAYHAEVHTGFAKLAREEQDARLRTMVSQLKRLLPRSTASGFRAPLEQYDANTERALRALGMRHHAASPSSRDDALPGFSTAEPELSSEDALVVLPRTWLDDINLFTAGLLTGIPAERMLLASLQDTVAMRGFGLLSLHTQNFYAGGVLHQVTPRLLEAVAKQRRLLWTPPGEAVAQWWRDRAAVSHSVHEEEGGVRLRLQVARGPVRGIAFVVFAPHAGAPRLEGKGARLEKLDAYRWALVFPQLDKGSAQVLLRF